MYEDIIESENPELEDLKEKLMTEYYSPSENGDMDAENYYNPGVKMYEEQHNWTNNGWDNISNTDILLRCPEYLPTDTAINELRDYDKIIEIGAGNGYWAHVINRNGGNCIPTDISPTDVPYDQLPENSHEAQERHNFTLSVERPFPDECDSFPCTISDERERIVWADVKFANHTCVRQSDAEYVLLCHPVKYEWTERLLDFIIENDQKLVLVAQWEPSPDATPRFFLRLHNNWELKDQFPILDWTSMHAHGYVFHPPNSISQS